jgi:zinc/manganese transport system permease protein
VTLYDLLVSPLTEFAFMRRAVVACIGLSLSAAPVGVFLMLRRLSLMGDALSHAVLPGAAIGYMVAGLSLGAMTVGGFAAGVVVALAAGAVTRWTPLKEDASFAAFYLIAIALGVLLVSLRGSGVDLLQVLFGSILAVDDAGMLLVAAVASVTLLALAVLYRPLVVETFDPDFLRAAGFPGGLVHAAFLVLVVLNLVAAFQALGTLMAVGLMMLPAATARFWAGTVPGLILTAIAAALLASVAGLLVSYHASLPSGPCVILAAGVICLVSVAAGTHGGLQRFLFAARHREA